MTDPTPGFETLTLEVEGELGFLTLNRPDRLNAMNATMLDELVEAASWLDRHLEVRVAIVRGAGRAFCAGADIRAADTSGSPSAPPPGSASWQARREAGQRGLRMTNAIEQMRAVTVAQLHGYAVGGGFLLAVSCDLRVAAEDAVFFIPEVELGIPLTWGGVPRLVRELGPALTKELANAAAEAMAPARSAYLEGDVLLGTSADEASREIRRRYAERTFGERSRARAERDAGE